MVAVAPQKVWSAKNATATVELSEMAHLASKSIQVNTAAFSGTLDFQGSLDGVNWINARYVELTGDGVLSIVNDQLSYAADTSIKVYMLAEWWPHVRLVMTRSAGTITVDAWGHETSPFLASNSAVAIWAAATRVLTDISMEDVMDTPGFDSGYQNANLTGGAADVFGVWAQISANVGTSKRLLYVVASPAAAWVAGEVEIGEGGVGAEARITGFGIPSRTSSITVIPVFKSLTNNARLSARLRESGGAAGLSLSCLIA